MDNCTILSKRIPKVESSTEEIFVVSSSKIPVKITVEVPVKIIVEPKVASLIITAPGPLSYSSSKVVPWNYGGDVFIHGIKQDDNIVVTNLNDIDIVGTSNITRSGRIFSP